MTMQEEGGGSDHREFCKTDREVLHILRVMVNGEKRRVKEQAAPDRHFNRCNEGN